MSKLTYDELSIGNTIAARVEIIEKMDDKKRVVLQTRCFNQNGDLVVDGEALVSPPR